VRSAKASMISWATALVIASPYKPKG
jgi:hypothetical protein